MLAKVAPTSADFHALARYLLRGKGPEPHPDRVQWAFTQNLATDNPLLAARYMEATASRSTRCIKPVYHLMVAWHQRERPSIDVTQEIACRTLEMAGLAEHQALIMGHGDTAHRHFHVMLNRVHPDTRKAWKTTNDFQRFDRIMRQLSDEYGFEYVPAHSFDPGLTDELPQLPDSKSYRAAGKGAHTGRVKWSRRASRELGEYLSGNLDRATTIDDLTMLAADHGLAFEPKGGGIVLGNREGYATLSSLGLAMTANGMLRRREAPLELLTPAASTRHWWDVDAVDLTRAFMAWGLASKDDLMQTINDLRAERAARTTARDSAGFMATLSLPAKPLRPPPQTRTALSTPHDALGRPARPLTRAPKMPNKDCLNRLIRVQTDRAVMDRHRRLIGQRRQLNPGAPSPADLTTNPWDKPPRGRA